MTEEVVLFNDLNELQAAKPAELIDLSELELKFEYTPAEIKIKNKEKFEQAIKAYQEKYDGYLVTEETFEQDAKVRASLNNLEKLAKNIVKDELADYNKPLDDVKLWLKNLLTPIQKVRDDIDEGVKAFEKLQREKRAEAIKAVFEAAIAESESDVDIRIFNEHFDGMADKKYFMADNVRVSAATKKKIAELVAVEVAKKQEHEQALIQITELAAKGNLGPAPYIRSYEQGASLGDVLRAITDDKEAAERFQAELKKKQEQEKRVEEFTAIAGKFGLEPSKYTQMVYDGIGPSTIHETLMTDYKNYIESAKAQETPQFVEKKGHIPTETEQTMNNTAEQENGAERSSEPRKALTKWQGDFRLTFPDGKTAKLFGAEGGLYEQYGIVVEKLGDWVKIND